MTTNLMKVRKTVTAYAFMMPALIILFLFAFIPIFMSLPLAFTDYSVIDITHFVGLSNFTKALNDNEFWISIKNSVLFVLAVPPLQILSLILAVLVNRKIAGMPIFRVLIYIPVVTSTVAISIMWNFIFEPNGVLNTALQSLHIIKSPIYFLQDSHIAIISLMVITIWQGLGYYMMLYLAGLQSVPADVEEAAKIDGANAAIILFKIKIPLLKPYVWFCSLTSVISAINVFDIVYVMTQGGPNDSTLVASYYSYKKAFIDYQFGYSAAVGFLFSIVTLLFSVVIFVYGKKGGMNNDE